MDDHRGPARHHCPVREGQRACAHVKERIQGGHVKGREGASKGAHVKEREGQRACAHVKERIQGGLLLLIWDAYKGRQTPLWGLYVRKVLKITVRSRNGCGCWERPCRVHMTLQGSKQKCGLHFIRSMGSQTCSSILHLHVNLLKWVHTLAHYVYTAFACMPV